MQTPTLIVIGGFAGAGKTTVAEKLSGKYNFPVLSSDVINDALRSALNKGFKEVSPAAHDILWYLVRRQLQLGVTVIVDTHMAAPHTWQKFDALTADLPKIQALPILLQATFETHKARIEERGRTNKAHLNLGGDKLEDVIYKYDYIEKLQRPDLIRINTDGSPNEVYNSVEKVLRDHRVIL